VSEVPEVSVIVPHLNQPALLRGLLESLFAQDFDMDRAEVIVVDNGSRQPPRAVVADFPGVVLAEEPTPGPGPTRNRGVALSRAPILAFTDSDCRVGAGWLATILGHFAADPGLAILGGDMRLIVAEPGDPTPVEAFECVYAFPQPLYILRKGFSVTANMALRRAVFDAVGPFAGIGIAEDRDWGQRARALGHVTRFKPDVVVHHPARRTMDELRDKCDRNVSHDFANEAGGLGGRLRWTAKALALAASPLAEIPRIARTDRVSGLRARARAFRGLAGFRLYRAGRMLRALVSEEERTASTRWNRSDRSMAGDA
jgi:glycosyltransferase involved in cell wall biosynthesis